MKQFMVVDGKDKIVAVMDNLSEAKEVASKEKMSWFIYEIQLLGDSWQDKDFLTKKGS